MIDMTSDSIRAGLAACRAELERQEAIEKAATPGPWRGPVGGMILNESNIIVIDPAGIKPQDESCLTLSRNLNPARLEAAKEKLTAAEQVWQSWTDLLDHQVCEEPTLRFTEERYVKMFVFEGGQQGLKDAARLLGVKLED